MASRLSEESVRAVLDAGQHGLVIEATPALEALAPQPVDLDALLNAEDPKAAVQAVAPQPLYQALLRRGPEDCLEILPLMSEEQVTRLFDYDAWHEDRLTPLKAVRWLNLFKEVSNEELVKRFRELDEEFQLALLGPLVEMVDADEFEKLSDAEQDGMTQLPCATLYYKIKTTDQRIEEFVLGLVEAALSTDVAYAYSLLAHAAYVPPAEQEAQLGQFRKARMEEDGFVSYQESLTAFQPVDLERLRQKWAFALNREVGLIPAGDSTEPFLQRVVAASAGTWTEATSLGLSQGLAFLVNSLCASVQVEPDDPAGLRRLMQHAQASVSLGLEALALGDVRAGAEILSKEHPQTLFRAGLTLVRKLAREALVRLPEGKELTRLLDLDRRGQLEVAIETALTPVVGFERTESLKGLCNRFPVRPVGMRLGDDGVERVTFKPVASLKDLTGLAATIDATLGLLHVAGLAESADVKESLDVRLETSLAQALAGGAFRYAPLGAAAAAKLLAMPPEAVQALTGDLFASVEGTLRLALVPATGHTGWSASRAAGLHVEDPVQGVLAEFSDLVMRLSAARASGVLSGIVREAH